ncbi:MAG: tryptophan--tRNA ligase [Saprospiraceae bacterium]
MNRKKEQILSCIQPTGEMHLGNFLGAIQNWVKLQNEYHCYYGVVDYHAMTMPLESNMLRQNINRMLIDLMACGIQPENLFLQSQIPEHTELGWILGCITPFGELSRQTQFKDKSQHLEEIKGQSITCGLFTYPVLQAADILIYHANQVPVGKDQEQHLELARNIAERFNKLFKCDYFALPECLFTEIPKVMSLADPIKKMSKSLGAKHYIGLFEEEGIIRTKVKTAVSSAGGNSGKISPGVENLLGLLHTLGSPSVYDELLNEELSGRLRYERLKEAVSDTLVEFTSRLRNKRESLMENEVESIERVYDSSQVIRQVAKQTLAEVRDIVGLSVMRQTKTNFMGIK